MLKSLDAQRGYQGGFIMFKITTQELFNVEQFGH
jgi:hypothetical protein